MRSLATDCRLFACTCKRSRTVAERNAGTLGFLGWCLCAEDAAPKTILRITHPDPNAAGLLRFCSIRKQSEHRERVLPANVDLSVSNGWHRELGSDCCCARPAVRTAVK